MSGRGRDPSEGDPLRRVTRGPLATLTVLVVAAAVVVVSGFGLVSTRTSEPSGSPAQASPSASAETPPEDWRTIGDLPPLEPVATLAPTAADSAGVAPESGFWLTSLTGIASAALAEGLTVEPAIDLRTTAGATPDTVTVTPSEPLVPGQRYRFRLRAPDDALIGTWAFTVKAPLHVVTTLPDDHSTGVPLDTGIELTFDQDGVTGAADRFSIEPRTDGRFETHGRTLVFVPTKLAPRTLYTVTLDAGVGVTGSDVTLQEPVRVRFETRTAEDAPREAQIVLGRTVIEADPREPPVIGLTAIEYDEEGEEYAGADTPGRLPVEIYRLPDQGAALTAAQTLADAPEWATTEAGLVTTDGLERVLAADAELQQVGDAQGIVLPEPLPAGSYLAVVPRQGRDAQALLQVTRLASYSLVSPTRSLFWVQRIGGGPMAGVDVAMADGTQIGTTDAHGLLQVTTPRALLRSDDATVFLTLTAPDGQTAIVPLGLTSRIESYPQDMHASIDDSLIDVLTPQAVGRSPMAALAKATRRNVDRDTATGATLASARVRAPVAGPILADTSDAGGVGGSIEDDRFWTILSTDRDAYRQTDTINLWGYLRERDTMQVPSDMRLRLVLADSDQGAIGAPALDTATVRATSSGAFQASFALKDVPLGSYLVQLEVAGRPVATRWLSIDVIRKPAYELHMTLDRHVRIDGQPIVATTSARFFEGTSAPGVEVAVDAGQRSRSATTGPDGTAPTTLAIRSPAYDDGLALVDVTASVVGAEEGEITTSDRVVVLPSSRWLTGEGNLDGRRLRLDGTVSKAAIASLERQFAALDPDQWIDELDPAGAPIASARVRVVVDRQVIVRTLSQQSYDFISKRVVPIYDEETRYVPVTTRVVRTDGRGRYALTIRVPSRKDTYRVRLSTTDGSGRTMAITVWTSPEERDENPFPSTSLDSPRDAEGSNLTYGTGDTVQLTLTDQDAPYASRDDAFLFVTAQRGLRDAVVQDAARYRHTLGAADAPGVFVEGVHFTGRTFVHAGDWVDFDASERQLAVRLAADRARYRPGERATITVRTSDRDGRPVPATVVLRAVDEKLFRIGAAVEEDPLGQLYASVSDGLYRSYTSHPLPRPTFGLGGGDVGGGGGREDFRDTMIYQQLETGSDGIGTTTIQLADDLTSWHLSASAVTADLDAGVGSLSVPVGLPFFVEATLAPEFVLADRPVLRLRAFGDALESGDTATFTVTFPTLGGAPVTVTATAFTPVDVPLPALQVGEQRLVIDASAHEGALGDRLTRTFRVIPARATRTINEYATLEAARGIASGPGLTTVIVSDAGRGSFLPVLEELAWSDGPRLDEALSAIVARDLLVERFGLDARDYPVPTFSADAYQRSDAGLALLPYGSASHDDTVRALLVDPARFDATAIRESMRSIISDPEATRERRVMALAGLALLGDEVLGDVRTAVAIEGLSIRERLYLAVAASTLGDQAMAIDIERGLIAERGERRGPWIRLADPTSSDASIASTALLAIVMVEVGDPLADEAEAYVEANPMRDDLRSLQRLAYAERALERAPTGASRFAYTVDGQRTEVDLEPGASRTLMLTEDQARSLRLEPLSGTVGVSVTRQQPLDAGDATPDPALTLTRTITPSGPIEAGRLVTVDLGITFGSQALNGCTEVVDQVPSGLAVSERLTGWADDEEASPAPVDTLSPDAIAGQRVTFCASPDPKRSVVRMRYHARVLGPGTYVWEPASAQSAIASELTSLTPAATVELR